LPRENKKPAGQSQYIIMRILRGKYGMRRKMPLSAKNEKYNKIIMVYFRKKINFGSV
jgi:hypothetical protein